MNIWNRNAPVNNPAPRNLTQKTLTLTQDYVGNLLVKDGRNTILSLNANGTISRYGGVAGTGWVESVNDHGYIALAHNQKSGPAIIKFNDVLAASQRNGDNRTFSAYELVSAPGGVRLVAVGPDGKRMKNANIAKFQVSGTIYLYHTVNPILGLQTDADGRVVVR